MESNVKRMALKDISEYFEKNNIKITDDHGDVFVVTPSHLDTKETRLLNRKLGLRNVNYTKESMKRR